MFLVFRFYLKILCNIRNSFNKKQVFKHISGNFCLPFLVFYIETGKFNPYFNEFVKIEQYPVQKTQNGVIFV
jgi:hypothetical protein